MKTKGILLTIGVAAMISLSGCGSWWATTSVGPDLYLDDYYGPGYYVPSYGGLYGPGYVYNVPPSPPPVVGSGPGSIIRPGTPPPPTPSDRPSFAPGNRPDNGPGGVRPSNNPGTPAQGGYRGQSGATSRH